MWGRRWWELCRGEAIEVVVNVTESVRHGYVVECDFIVNELWTKPIGGSLVVPVNLTTTKRNKGGDSSNGSTTFSKKY